MNAFENDMNDFFAPMKDSQATTNESIALGSTSLLLLLTS